MVKKNLIIIFLIIFNAKVSFAQEYSAYDLLKVAVTIKVGLIINSSHQQIKSYCLTWENVKA